MSGAPCAARSGSDLRLLKNLTHTLGLKRSLECSELQLHQLPPSSRPTTILTCLTTGSHIMRGCQRPPQHLWHSTREWRGLWLSMQSHVSSTQQATWKLMWTGPSTTHWSTQIGSSRRLSAKKRWSIATGQLHSKSVRPSESEGLKRHVYEFKVKSIFWMHMTLAPSD